MIDDTKRDPTPDEPKNPTTDEPLAPQDETQTDENPSEKQPS